MSVRARKLTSGISPQRAGTPIGRQINDAASPPDGLEAVCLKHLREICLPLPETTETVKWGHPTFEAGQKAFAVLDDYHGQSCIAFRTSVQKLLLQDPRYFPAPYAAARGWICLRADTGLDWPEIGELIVASYRLAALKRMLSALDRRRRHPSKSP